MPGEGAGGAGTEAVRSLGEKLGPLVEQYIAGTAVLQRTTTYQFAMCTGPLNPALCKIWIASRACRPLLSGRQWCSPQLNSPSPCPDHPTPACAEDTLPGPLLLPHPAAAIPTALEALRMKDALKAAMLVSKAGNLFFQVCSGGR